MQDLSLLSSFPYPLLHTIYVMLRYHSIQYNLIHHHHCPSHPLISDTDIIPLVCGPLLKNVFKMPTDVIKMSTDFI